MVSPPAPVPERDEDRLLLAALDHAWKWVDFRLGHRIQAVNYYLIVVAFLAAAYVTTFTAAAAVNRVGSRGIRGRRWRWSPTRTSGSGTSRARVRAAARTCPTRPRWGWNAARCSTCHRCRCGSSSTSSSPAAAGAGPPRCGTAPQGVTAPVQYGPRITAIVLYLYVGQFLSKKRAAPGAGRTVRHPGLRRHRGDDGRARRRRARRVPGRGRRPDRRRPRWPGSTRPGCAWPGKLHWVHCARTGKYTLITCHPKRGTKGIDAAGVLGRFGGVAVHDAWAPYDTYADVEHQLCCAHALRELAAVTDTAPADADWCWATQAADALVAIQTLVADATTAGADRR